MAASIDPLEILGIVCRQRVIGGHGGNNALERLPRSEQPAHAFRTGYKPVTQDDQIVFGLHQRRDRSKSV